MARQHVINVMDHNGHSPHQFDPDDVVSVEAAKARFQELMSKGCFAFEGGQGGSHKQVKAFDPNIENVVFSPQLIGG